MQLFRPTRPPTQPKQTGHKQQGCLASFAGIKQAPTSRMPSLHEKFKAAQPPPMEAEEPWAWRSRRWRHRVLASELPEIVREGDIVLFSGNEVQEGCLRCITNRRYNHVGLVIRKDLNGRGLQTYIMESTTAGVGFAPLMYYVQVSQWADVNKRYKRVAVRRLFVEGKRLQHHRDKRKALHKYLLTYLLTYLHTYLHTNLHTYKALYKYVLEMQGKAYEKDLKQLVKAFLRRSVSKYK